MSIVLKTEGLLPHHPWVQQMRSCQELRIPMVVVSLTQALALPRLVSAVDSKQGEPASDQLGGIALFDATSFSCALFSADSLEDFKEKFQKTLRLCSVDQYRELLDAVDRLDLSASKLQLISRATERTWQIEFLTAKVFGNECFGLALMSDVTENVMQAQKAQCFEQLCENLNDYSAIVGLDGEIEFLNSAGRLSLVKLADPRPARLQELLSATGAEGLKQGIKFASESGQTWYGKLEFIDGNGGRLPEVNASLSPIFARKGSGLLGFAMVATPSSTVDELKRQLKLRDKLIEEAGRLVMLGQISSQVIHEINNPLTVITGKAEKIVGMANHASPDWRVLSECGDKILRMTRRTEKIIRSMKALAFKPSVGVDKPLSLRSVIEDVRDLIEIGSGRFGVSVRIPEIPEQLFVRAERVKLSQVFVNLFSNAYDAVANSAERWVELTLEIDSQWLHVRVIDSGPGISPEIESRLFEGYFTTKVPGQGTGMGLNLSRQLVRAAGGDLYLDKAMKMTAFVIRLPRVDVHSEAEGENWDEI